MCCRPANHFATRCRKASKRNTLACVCAPPGGDAEEEWPKEHRVRHAMDSEERGPCLRCRRCWRKTTCRRSRRWFAEKKSCWKKRNWKASTANYKPRRASRPTHQPTKKRIGRTFQISVDTIIDSTLSGKFPDHLPCSFAKPHVAVEPIRPGRT